MPLQPFVYVADSAWCPYGTRPYAALRERVGRIVDYLLAEGCAMVVLACNTATAAAVAQLRARYVQPFIGMEPAVKPAALCSRSGHIGVLATEGTLRGRLFQRSLTRYGSHATVHFLEGKGLVERVEAGEYETAETVDYLRQLLAPLLALDIDHLVLGCTHYPFLTRALAQVLPAGVEVVDPAPAVARQAARVFGEHAPTEKPEMRLEQRIRLLSTARSSRLGGHYSYYSRLVGGAGAGDYSEAFLPL